MRRLKRPWKENAPPVLPLKIHASKTDFGQDYEQCAPLWNKATLTFEVQRAIRSKYVSSKYGYLLQNL